MNALFFLCDLERLKYFQDTIFCGKYMSVFVNILIKIDLKIKTIFCIHLKMINIKYKIYGNGIFTLQLCSLFNEKIWIKF